MGSSAPVNPFDLARADAATIATRTGAPRHDVAVVLGSGWAAAAALLGETRVEMGVQELAGFPLPSVAGHPGRLRSVELDGARVLVALGRAHLYEGNGAAAPAQPEPSTTATWWRSAPVRVAIVAASARARSNGFTGADDPMPPAPSFAGPRGAALRWLDG